MCRMIYPREIKTACRIYRRLMMYALMSAFLYQKRLAHFLDFTKIRLMQNPEASFAQMWLLMEGI